MKPRSPASTAGEPSWTTAARAALLDVLRAEGIRDEAVLAALERVPRHLFVAAPCRAHAYRNAPLSIGYGQTISQPFIVAYMTQVLQLAPGDKVLEVGTGSGYQAAVLAELGCEVWSVEILAPIGYAAAARLRDLGYDRVHVRVGDGARGWPEQAPFDACIVTAASDRVPPALLDQLRTGGRLIAPLGPPEDQLLVLFTRTEVGFTRRVLIPVRFVPLTGAGQARR